ncbi:hypothetical protein PV05_01090 [Exophiala xenobiotica]|uniref:Phosphatidate phosphatase APP1 catalytic domain-containing protein n=1 Tax=Exophiala xenobiotica TaxID=348802 RepID=A0A0D2C7K1_9EURO|nr:uncharacterized protein PV05_01090 [Exophiala xenobiotica]KIW60911.1 hypothetical protein PV05_01090 [Exophiala xenobiotica]
MCNACHRLSSIFLLYFFRKVLKGSRSCLELLISITVAPPFRGVTRSRNTFNLLRYLFPNTHRRAREGYLGFRHEYIPRLKLQAQSHIYQAIVRSQRRKQEKRAAGRGLVPFIRRRKSHILRALYGKHHAGARVSQGTRSTDQMTSYGQSGAKVPGSRRDRVRGYLRAANELRQVYQESISQRLQGSETDGGMPGDYPDVDIVRSGDEELLLFPSYARKHTKRKGDPSEAGRSPPGTNESIEAPHSSGDAEYWKREWERYEDANAIVDVDVRGWIYSPQSGPLSRKNRLLLAVARRLSGVYAPLPGPSASQTSHQTPIDQDRREDSPSRYEDELAAREAENIARRGELEAAAAQRGSYSQANGDERQFGSDSPAGSRSGSPGRRSTFASGESEDCDPGHDSLKKRQSWNEPASMSREQLAAANQLLLTRLKPFMTTPVAHTPITVFLFNDQKSASKSVTTDDSGHFNLRAALDFVPTQVRVLASDKLSATEDVIITESKGISLISDIDDTIKHSAIASGAREIFKNTFIRELSDLTIKGVKEWYSKLANMGVKLHYVSNSPWQLYPLLRSYFALAGLPAGSIHLKQYSGMLQGIFEPAAERKRGTINRLMTDFPDRKFILVGDSGEADLEVYTDVVLEYPRRILGVFIRDVTTPPKKGFFDQSVPNTLPDSMISSENGNRLGRPTQSSNIPENRPLQPPRPKPQHKAHSMPPREEDLIDFGNDADSPASQDKPSHTDDLRQLSKRPAAPAKPNKPSSLRNFSTQSMPPTDHDRLTASDTEIQEPSKRKPPPPPRPRRSGGVAGSEGSNLAPLPRAPFSSPRQNQSQPQPTASSTEAAPKPPIRRTNTSTSTASSQYSHYEEGYIASARRQISSAYNALPAMRSSSPSRPADQTGISSDNRPNPPLPPRRGLSGYSAAAARWATGATGGDPAAGGDGGVVGGTYDKKLEIWKRRWARAEEIMNQRGIVLRSWRVGSDVMDECVRLVKREMERDERSME